MDSLSPTSPPFNVENNYFPDGRAVINPPANAADARDVGSIPGSGRSPGIGTGNPLQYSCLENSTVRGVWWVHGVAKSQTQLNTQHTHIHLVIL